MSENRETHNKPEPAPHEKGRHMANGGTAAHGQVKGRKVERSQSGKQPMVNTKGQAKGTGAPRRNQNDEDR